MRADAFCFRNAQNAEEVPAYKLAKFHLRQRALLDCESKLGVLRRRQALERMVSVTEIGVIGVRESRILKEPSHGFALQSRLHRD